MSRSFEHVFPGLYNLLNSLSKLTQLYEYLSIINLVDKRGQLGIDLELGKIVYDLVNYRILNKQDFISQDKSKTGLVESNQCASEQVTAQISR